MVLLKYQMPKLHEIIDSAVQINTKDALGQVRFTSLDPKYAFSQLSLSDLTSSYCNFSILCGEATGIYRFKTEFYGLADMHTEFQKAMDSTLNGLEGVICYFNDILMVTKGDVYDHDLLADKVMRRLDEEGWALNYTKWDFSVNKLVWLGYEIDKNGYTQNFPKSLRQLRLFMTMLNHLQCFIPDIH